MAAITQTVVGNPVPTTLTKTVLTAADTITYSSGTKQKLVLFNTTASPVVVTIDGAGSTTIAPAGFGGTVDVSAGKDIAVPASGVSLVELDKMSAFLGGAIAVTGGVGVEAVLFA